jgi:signal transduction histidine kinase
MENGNTATGELGERFRKIREQSQRAAKLTSQLLAFGRRQILQPRKVNLNLFIREEMSFLGKIVRENLDVRIVEALVPPGAPLSP